MIDLKKLIEAGVHFGHQTWRWCPKMKPYIWGSKNSIHLIDVSKTAVQMEKAAQALEQIAAEGKPILWVGTKKAAQKPVLDVAQRLQCPYVTHRWIGGTLTNFPQVKKSVTKLLHYEDILSKANEHFYTKKELGLLQKMAERHRKNVGGITKLTWPIGAVVVVDVKKEHTAVKEAVAAGVPVIGIVDTNSDPSLIQYVIPANDDIVRSINIILGYLADATDRGYAKADRRPQEQDHQEGHLDRLMHDALPGEDEEEKARRPQHRRGRGTSAVRSRRPGPAAHGAPPSAEVSRGETATPVVESSVQAEGESPVTAQETAANPSE